MMQRGAAHAKAGQHEAAEAAFSRAHKQCMLLMKHVQGADITEAQHCDIMAGCMDLLLDRLTNAWKLRQEVERSTCTFPLITPGSLHRVRRQQGYALFQF